MVSAREWVEGFSGMNQNGLIPKLDTEELWNTSKLKSKTFKMPLLPAVFSYRMIARGQRRGLQPWILPRDPFGWQRQQQQQREVPRARFWAVPVPRRAEHPSGPTEWCAEGRKKPSFTQEHRQAQAQTRESEEAIIIIFFFPFTRLHWLVVPNLTHTEEALSYTTKQTQKHKRAQY